MARHLFKSSYGQCQCRLCGAGKHGQAECRVTDEMRLALRTFAASNGRTWKMKLRIAWMDGKDLGPELQQCRNIIGPTRLERITRLMLEHCVPSKPRD
jgi:hypothetical protein